MAIFEYAPEEHPAYFVGLRVAVSIDSKFHQRYFTYTKKQGYRDRPSILHCDAEIALLKKDAEKLNARWIKEQLKYKKIRNTFGKPLSSTSNRQWHTGIRGLTCRYKVNDIRTAKGALVFCISLFVTTENGDKIQQSYIVPDESQIEAVWQEMASTLAVARGLKRTPPRWIQGLPTAKDRAKMKRKAKKLYLSK